MNREQAIDQMLARDEIRDLAHRYSFAADSLDYDAVAELFDPEVDNGKLGKGREALKEHYKNLLGAMPDGAVAHLISNHQIDFVDDTTAWGMCYVRAVAKAGEHWTEVVACYIDDYVKRDGHWFFARRRPADLQRFMIEGKALGDGKISLGKAWEIHRERQAQLRS
jgi:SnoaL-like domain